MKQYSVDLRERLLRAIDAGLSQAEAARLFGVGTATIERWRRCQREQGTVAAAADRTGPGAGLAGPGAGLARCHLGRALCAVGRRAGDPGQRSHHVALTSPAGVAAEKKSLHASERNEAARAAWRAEVAALDPARLVFVDESGTHTAMTRLRSRAPRGERAIGRVPRNHGPNVTLFAALTPQGMGPAMLVEGGADQAACAAYVGQLLVPSLHPGQVVVMDQLNVHKSATIRAAIEAAGCELRLLPAYSPDFNPIEPAFAKIKTHLRAAEPRTFATLVAAVGAALETVTPADASGCFAHCGYPLSHHLL